MSDEAPAATYVDTSALAKWYIDEPRSEDFERWIRDARQPTISSLTVTEMRCLIGRRCRTGTLEQAQASEVFARFMADVERRFFAMTRIDDSTVRAATHLIDELAARPLRTLDALHLSTARALATPELATADAVMADAAADLGMKVVRFD